MYNVFYRLAPEPLSWKEFKELEMKPRNEDQQMERMDSDRLVRVESIVETIGDDLQKMDHKLFGNGRPGLIAVMEARIKFLEDQRTKLFAYGSALVFIIQFITGGGVVSLKSLLGK